MAFQVGAFQLDAFQQGSGPPTFLGQIPNIFQRQDTGSFTYDLSAYFLGADSYAIAPALESGWSFDTNTGELVIDTDALGTFGPFTVTATNATGDTPSNAFSVEVAALVEEATPGWLMRAYEREHARRAKERRKRRELEEEAERIEEETTREIAQLLREQEAKDARRAELARLSDLVARFAARGEQAALSERVQKSLNTAVEKKTAWSLFQLERELKRAKEEEDFVLQALQFVIDND